MDYAIGVALALGVAAFAALSGLDRDRAFWAVVLIVVAHYYNLFAVIGGDLAALRYETAFFVLFAGLAVAGFRTSQWLVAAGLIAHGLFDYFRGGLVANAGVPPWWPNFCMAFDVAAGAYLAVRLLRETGGPRVHASESQGGWNATKP